MVGVLGFVGYSNMRETGRQVDVIQRESGALRTLSDMKSHVLEGIEEAFAYPLLNDPHEKEKFYEKLDNFDTFVASFREGFSSIRGEQEEEFELLDQIVSAKEAEDADSNQRLVGVFPGHHARQSVRSDRLRGDL